jgi:L-asparaginase II
VAAATPEGRLVAFQGDPDGATFLRSAAKPFQAVPLLLAGVAERFALDAADLALICASHGGTPAHVERAAALLARGGFTVDDLQCGAHPPFDDESAERLRREGLPPTALHNNCSGKHAGMLLACRALGLPTANYLELEHPWQQRLLGQLATFHRLAPGEIGLGIDGCGVPTFHVPLAAAARAYAALADPRAAALAPDAAAAADTVVRAMTGVPTMVAGPGRFTTRLMAATGGRVLAKEGAEGFYALAVRGPVALGIAVKIADGGLRCRDGVVLDVLRELGSLSGDEFESLRDLHSPALLNHRGVRVGEIRPEVQLEDVGLEEGRPEEV